MRTFTAIFSYWPPKGEQIVGVVTLLSVLPLFKAHIFCEIEAWNPISEVGYLLQLSSALGMCLHFRTCFCVAWYLGNVLCPWIFTHNFHGKKIVQRANEKEETVCLSENWNEKTNRRNLNLQQKQGQSCGPLGLDSLLPQIMRDSHWK